VELKNLLSIVIAALTTLGAILFAMGSKDSLLAMAVWLAAVVSLVVTDFLGAVRMPRNLALVLMWAVLAIFMPHFLMQSAWAWESRLQTVAGVLMCLQILLLFQDKEPRAFGWLAVMSLLQVVVAARYSEGVIFGGLLIVYTIVGIFVLSLLVLYSQAERHRGEVESRAKARKPALVVPGGRWPLAAVKSSFTSAPAGGGRAGVVLELFARLTLTALGASLLAAIIFSTVPRPRLPAWRGGGGPKTVATVGFNDHITLGGLGDTIESRQEVMQLKLLDPATREIYPMRDDVYLRGSMVTSYSQNRWRREPPTSPRGLQPDPQLSPDASPENLLEGKNVSNGAFRIGPPVIQEITTEPYLEPEDIFYIWPLAKRPADSLAYSAQTGRLWRKPLFSREPRGGNFKCEVVTSGLVDGHQAQLVPVAGKIVVLPYLQMPGGQWSLPRLTALAGRWLKEGSLSPRNHYEAARWFERQLSSSGQFQYSLQGPERDASIDAIEDFVSKNRRGHCEYFATALALMLRSQGIPSRVVLGYHCDEWHEDEKYYQVRQLHAHAWVEAFLNPDQIPESFRQGAPIRRWQHGGWLRLDPTPAGETGTQAAERTAWGAWQTRWHNLQRSWDKYIVEMDRKRQRESVYEPISRATRSLTSRLLNPHWWKELVVGLWASLATMLRSGIMGWLLGVAMVAAIVVVPLLAGWWLAGRLVRLWRRLSGNGGRRGAGARSSIEFYRRFEQIVARLGLQRPAGQTPREFARAIGTRLAAVSGRDDLPASAILVAEAFYSVRFGRHELDAAAARIVQQALGELAAGAEKGSMQT
jgi:hypothetical protein